MTWRTRPPRSPRCSAPPAARSSAGRDQRQSLLQQSYRGKPHVDSVEEGDDVAVRGGEVPVHVPVEGVVHDHKDLWVHGAGHHRPALTTAATSRAVLHLLEEKVWTLEGECKFCKLKP